MTSSNGNIFRVTALCAGNSSVTGEFPAQRPVTRSFDVFFGLRLNKRLSKQSWDWWFEKPPRSLWPDFVRCSGYVAPWWQITKRITKSSRGYRIWYENMIQYHKIYRVNICQFLKARDVVDFIASYHVLIFYWTGAAIYGVIHWQLFYRFAAVSVREKSYIWDTVGAVITRSNRIWYWIYHCNWCSRIYIKVWTTKDTIYLALADELWVSISEGLGDRIITTPRCIMDTAQIQAGLQF